MFGAAMNICEVTSPTTADPDFLAKNLCVIKQQGTAAALTELPSTKQASRSSANHNSIYPHPILSVVLGARILQRT